MGCVNSCLNLDAKSTTTRVMLTLAFFREWKVRQVDVNNAFLYSDLLENVFMS